MAASRRPATTSVNFKQSLEPRDVLCCQNEYSDEVWSNPKQDSYYKGFAGAKPAGTIGQIKNMRGACKPRARRSAKAEKWSTRRRRSRPGSGNSVNDSAIGRSRWRWNK
jgi:hypothetical protein